MRYKNTTIPKRKFQVAKLFRISDAASLGLHAMAVLASDEQHRWTVGGIASELGVSTNHLAKIFQRLVKTGLVESERGPNGGVRLARAAGNIDFLQIYEAVEGTIDENYCLLGRDTCASTGCILGGLMESVNKEVHEYFKRTTLDRFVVTKEFETTETSE